MANETTLRVRHDSNLVLIGIACLLSDSVELEKIGVRQAAEQQTNEKGQIDAIIDQRQVEHSANDMKDKLAPLIPNSMKKLFVGMARVNRDQFTKRFDIGVPLDATKPGNEDVLILYSDEKSFPDGYASRSEEMPKLTAKTATKHCNTLKVVLTQPHQTKQCLAIMGQWESYHVHRFARFPPNMNGPVDETDLLQYVSRVPGENGKTIERRNSYNTNKWDKMLIDYLSNLERVLQELKPIAEKVAKNNTIVVMVCNLGQSELMINFACAAKSRGLDLSQLLVFATDLETKALAERLGLGVFYDQLV